MKTPELTTKRILLRPLCLADAGVCFRNWASDPEVAKFTSWGVHEKLEDTLAWLRAEQKNLSSDSSYNWGFVLKQTGELFGSGGFHFNEMYQVYEIGYSIMRRYWNQGLATEATEAIIAFARKIGIPALFGRHAKENPASGRVMEHLGFTYRGDGKCCACAGSCTFESKEYYLTL